MKLHKPFNPDGDTLTTTSKIGDILDKGYFKSNFQNSKPLENKNIFRKTYGFLNRLRNS